MIEPIFNNEQFKLYNCNFQDVIHDLDFDYIITDPPYNVNYKYPDYNDKMSDEDYVEMLSELNQYNTIMIHYPEEFMGGNVCSAMGIPRKSVSWCYNSNLQRQHRAICWFNCIPDFTRVKQPYKNPNDKRIKKLIEEGSEGTRLYDWWNDINLIKNVSKEKTSKFTNQIPIQLLERIIKITTEEGDTILDPFFGSGSLYFACRNTNRKCIGIEQSKNHLKAFNDRNLNHLNN